MPATPQQIEGTYRVLKEGLDIITTIQQAKADNGKIDGFDEHMRVTVQSGQFVSAVFSNYEHVAGFFNNSTSAQETELINKLEDIMPSPKDAEGRNLLSDAISSVYDCAQEVVTATANVRKYIEHLKTH